MYTLVYSERYIEDKHVNTLDEVKELVYDEDRYLEWNRDSLIENFDYNYDNWSFGSHSWYPSEILQALDSDMFEEVIAEDARYNIENMQSDYDSELEALEPGDSVEISEVCITVYRDEDGVAIEEDAEPDHDMMQEAALLL